MLARSVGSVGETGIITGPSAEGNRFLCSPQIPEFAEYRQTPSHAGSIRVFGDIPQIGETNTLARGDGLFRFCSGFVWQLLRTRGWSVEIGTGFQFDAGNSCARVCAPKNPQNKMAGFISGSSRSRFLSQISRRQKTDAKQGP